jgi:GTP-binding protein EngB required for normal cell division
LLGGFFQRVGQVQLAVLLIDSRRGFLESDMSAVRQLLERNFRILTILTKSDKLSVRELQDRVKNSQTKFGLNVIPFSIQSSMDQDEVWKQIDHAL